MVGVQVIYGGLHMGHIMSGVLSSERPHDRMQKGHAHCWDDVFKVQTHKASYNMKVGLETFASRRNSKGSQKPLLPVTGILSVPQGSLNKAQLVILYTWCGKWTCEMLFCTQGCLACRGGRRKNIPSLVHLFIHLFSVCLFGTVLCWVPGTQWWGRDTGSAVIGKLQNSRILEFD